LTAAERLAAIWAQEASRRPLWLAVAFGSGVALYFLLPAEPPALLAATIAGPALLALVLSGQSGVRLFAWPVLLFALGFGAGQWRVAAVEAPELTRATPRFEAEACIRSITPRATYTQIVASAWSADAPVPGGFSATLRWRSAPEDLRPGEQILVSARLFPVSEAIYPGSYDPKRLAFFDSVGGEGWIGKSTRRIGTCREPTSLEDARRWFRDRLLEVAPSSAGGLLVGVSTGWRGDIPRDDVDAMRDAGLGHLLAISGLHVGLAVGLILVSLRAGLALIPPVALRFPIKKWAAAAGLASGFAYLAFSGGSIPTQRAMIMLGLVLIALLLDRIELSMRPIAWAAVIVLAATPEAILSPSFQLSFAAVIGLVSVFETWRRRKNRHGPRETRWPWLARYLAGVSATTLIATVATMPFAAFHFHQIALVGLAANLVAVPVFAFWVMPALLIGVVLLPAGLEQPAWAAAAAGADLILAVAHGLTGWEGAVAKIGVTPKWGIAFIAAGGLWWAIWQQPWRWAGAAVAVIGLAAPLTGKPPDLILGSKHAAVSTQEGTYWLNGRRGFVPDIWMRETGGKAVAWPAYRAEGAESVRLSCDAQACLYDTPTGRIALVEDPAAAYECRNAVVGFSRWPAPGCVDLPIYGEVQVVRLTAEGVRIESNWSGERPWN